MMVACLMLVLLYFAVPYPAYQAVRYWTGSPAASWVGAIVAVPAGVLLYVRLFERLKHGARHKGGRPSAGAREMIRNQPMTRRLLTVLTLVLLSRLWGADKAAPLVVVRDVRTNLGYVGSPNS